MKILNLMKILLLCVMTAGLASCGDDNYYTIQNSDEKLCSDSWVEEYDTEKRSVQAHPGIHQRETGR